MYTLLQQTLVPSVSASKFTGDVRLRSTVLAERCNLNPPAVLTSLRVDDFKKSFHGIFDTNITAYTLLNALYISTDSCRISFSSVS